MVNPRKLNEVVVETLNSRIGDEYTAHYFYTAADKLAALELIDVNVKLDVLHFEEMYFKM